jgi:diguanylate cyclase (GGDEF)-like protein
VLATLACASARAADPAGSHAFRSYGADEGLRNQAVTSLAQDRQGFVYVGTEDGLYRFDGERFTRFGAEAGLPSDAITLLHATPEGELWVATQEGLVAWSASGNHASAKNALPGREAIGVASARNGAMLVATTSGFFEKPAQDTKFTAIDGVPRKAGAAWISADGGTEMVAVDGALYERAGHGAWRKRALPAAQSAQAVQAIVRDARGRFWFRGRQMLFRIAGFDGAIEDLGAKLPGAAVQKGELLLDRQGRVWAPSNHGLACFDGDRRLLIDVAHGLPNEWATTTLVDREGNLWVASEGVHRLLGRLAWTSYTRAQGLPSDTVWAEFRDRQGTLWAATNSGVAHGTDAGFVALPEGGKRSFYAFAQSPSGELWIGGNTGEDKTNSLLLRRAGNEHFESVPLDIGTGASTVNSLAFGADGALYVATMAQGLRRIEPEGNKFRVSTVTPPGGTPDEQINQLTRGSDGRLWGASMRGLLMFDGKAWRRFGVKDGLLEMEVETVAAAADGAMWVSYWNQKGLSDVRLDANGALQVHQHTTPPALVEDTIYSSGASRDGGLWLGTAHGIKRWRGGQVERFGVSNGLPGEDAAANAYLGEANGDAWFGMANGLAHFDASEEGGARPAPNSVVTGTENGTGTILAGTDPQVPWRQRALTFHFAALSFSDPSRLQRQVRLLGLEDDWRDTSVGEARYTGLLPGQYHFQVRARLGDGAYGPVTTRVVTILPPWWLTWWFGLLVLAAVVLLARLLLVWNSTKLRKKNVELEAVIAERTRDLQAANEALTEASMVDPLTGLKNRRYLNAFMPAEIAQSLRHRRRMPRDDERAPQNIDLCLFLVDLDHFKSVNDLHGHGAGDEVLRQVGEVLLHSCRASDVVVRWGGEEFLVLARSSDRTLARVLAAQVCQAMRTHPFDLGNAEVLQKTCSVGFTAFPLLPSAPERFSWEEAIELADQCLYAAKHSGRDGWVGACLLDPDHAPGPEIHALPGYGPAHIVTSQGEVGALRWKG